ncbi:MAG TPA: VOC family protein [Pyrinomonadaceae bacterium]|nr:VOC family protein [Pyrinomonadaceae bacterium]
MAELHSLSACFPVADISATIRWYEEQLGFIADPFPANEPYVFAILSRDEVEIFLQRVEGYQKPNLYAARAGGVWDLYIRTEGVKDLYESVRQEAEVVQPLRLQPYGAWEFEIRDLNGYVLVFSELERDL